MPYQKAALREALRKDEDGKFVYSTIVWSDIKKSAKSSIAGAVSLYIADLMPWSENYFIANDLKQADSRSAKYARRAITLSPYLIERFKAAGYRISHKANGSVIEAVPIDPEGEAGSNANCIMFSELWGAMDDKKSRMWTEMTLSPTKFGESFRWVETYAGFQEESDILYELWRLGTQEGKLIWPDRLFGVTNGPPSVLQAFKNEEARLFCLWNTEPRCPWQTLDYYKQEAAMLHPMEFQRMHRNQWISKTDTYIPIEWWDACARDELPEIPENWSIVIALDAAVSDDTFGLIFGCRHPDVKAYPNDVMVLGAYCWEPIGGRKIDFVGTPENPGPELVLRELIKKYNVVEVAYDEYQLHDMASRLYREGLAFFRKFPQGGGKHSRLVADSALRDIIRERRIWHKDIPKVREHLINSDAKIDNEDRKVRIVKRTQKLKIDLSVCLSMMTYEVTRLNL